jgi:predicted DCC family thiol-disulfide oxidoreductase YuxK
MLCWDWSSGLRLPKRFTGESPPPECGAGYSLAVAGATLPQCHRPGPHIAPAALPLRITMTADQPAKGTSSPSQTVVLYDGVCGLCNWLVAFLIRHDRRDQFRFAPLQSEFAQDLLDRHGLNPTDFDTVVVLVDFQQASERALVRLEAALATVIRLGGLWRIFALARLLPLGLREALYRFIARRRYRVFGKYDVCPLPRPRDRHKFLG